MDELSVTHNFSPAFPGKSSLEENFAGIHLEEAGCADRQYASSNNIAFNVITPLERSHNLVFKRSFDILVSIVLIVFILSWLVPLLAILIKLDSKGPVFFLQKRNKDRGHFFDCIKFRTMIVNKEADILVASENDKRITKLGRFLRSHHLDELPQLLNVLLGDMSLIGPRPHMVNENILYGKLLKEYSYRHTVKPGITGLAQSLGNVGATQDLEKVKERVDLDIFYIRQWSVAMELKILYRTCRLILGL